MTKEEWKNVEKWWGIGHGYVKMAVDEHTISLYNLIDKKKMIVEVAIYVDGYMKGTYSDVKSETGNRFWQRIKKPMYSTKELKSRIKDFGKRSKMAKQVYLECNMPYWRSFNALKKHIINNNTNIELICCGWEESEAKDVQDD